MYYEKLQTSKCEEKARSIQISNQFLKNVLLITKFIIAQLVNKDKQRVNKIMNEISVYLNKSDEFFEKNIFDV